ncbi:MAG: phosphodiester glycosidase family protein [Verrucomicrobiota bacterium]
MKIPSLAGFLLFATVSLLPAGWKLESNKALHRAPDKAFTILEKKVKHGPSEKRTLTVRGLLFDARQCRLRVLDQGSGDQPRFRNLGQAMATDTFIAGTNGGYFDPEMKPLGLVIADGKRAHRFQNAKLLTGVVLSDQHQPSLLWRKEFSDSKSLTQLIQAGPRLVSRAHPIPGLSDRKLRRRTFIATDQRHFWFLGTTSHATLAEMGQLLSHQALFPELKIQRALNLDGGSSTGLWLAPQSDFRGSYQREMGRVRNFIGIQRKP